MWEFEWFKALHLLRDGTQLPEPDSKGSIVDPGAIDKRVETLRRMPLSRIVQEDPPPPEWEPKKTGDRAGLAIWTEWAERVRAQQIAEQLALKPRQIQSKTERREIWASLWRAKNTVAVRRACERWKALQDVRASGLSVFADHAIASAKSVLEITRNPRFPTKPASDDSRLGLVAAGMAAVMVERSPNTGIERSRNLNHKLGGPLWKGDRCLCWRCEDREYLAQSERIRVALEEQEREEDV
jgi:hypothetical protein